MRFIDTSSRDPKDALATWLRDQLQKDVAAIFIQTGYFSGGSVDFLLSVMDPRIIGTCEVHMLIGSNDPRTFAGDVERLIDVLQVPRDNVRLGVVGFDDGLFHPKCYAIKKIDGSMACYVGSGNFTGSGLAKNIEAGIVIDSKTEDGRIVCNQIASAICSWFALPKREGFHRITSTSDILQLVTTGLLSLTALTKHDRNPSGTNKNANRKPLRLDSLITWPVINHGHSSTKRTDLADGSLPTTVPSKIINLHIGDILIAEITKGREGRSSRQIDLKKDIADVYFGGVNATIRCRRISAAGDVESDEGRQVGTKSSANFYIELSGLKGNFDGDYRARPLLLMARYPANRREYFFFWLYPDDKKFDQVYNSFIAPTNRKGTQSIKVIRPYSSFATIWPENPFKFATLKAKR